VAPGLQDVLAIDKKPASVVIGTHPRSQTVETATASGGFSMDARPDFLPGLDLPRLLGHHALREDVNADVIVTFVRAIALVILVVFVFLQN